MSAIDGSGIVSKLTENVPRDHVTHDVAFGLKLSLPYSK